jgi:hypothetical protein
MSAGECFLLRLCNDRYFVNTKEIPHKINSTLQVDSKFLSGFSCPIILKPKKIKLRTKYKSAAQEVLLILKIFLVTFSYFVGSFVIFISCLTIIGHGNIDNNFESHCRYCFYR